MWPNTYPMPYTFYLYGLLYPFTTYMAFSIWNLFTVIGVTSTHSCGNISEWGQTLFEYTNVLVEMNHMIRSLKFLKRFPWSGLVINTMSSHLWGTTQQLTLSCLYDLWQIRIVCLCSWFSCYLCTYRSSQSVWRFGFLCWIKPLFRLLSSNVMNILMFWSKWITWFDP